MFNKEKIMFQNVCKEMLNETRLPIQYINNVADVIFLISLEQVEFTVVVMGIFTTVIYPIFKYHLYFPQSSLLSKTSS